MIKCGTMMGLIAAQLLFAGKAQAEDKEPSAEVEIGGAGEWSLRDGGSSFGPTVAIEVTPLKDWLEIEAGVTTLFGGGHTEWGADLVFKKPYALSDTVELTFGVGPEWLHKTVGGKMADSVGGEAVLDFQFWQLPERKFGWFLEPTYGYDFGRGHEQSLGLSVGLLIAIP
jgi:hypothetical protein